MKKIYALAPVLVTGIIVGGMTLTKGNAYLDLDGLNQQVQRHDEQLTNHEVRIKNNENDVKDIQDKTATPPSSNNTEAPQVVTVAPEQTEKPAETAPSPAPPPTPPAEPEPVVVESYRKIEIENTENVDCELTYSDNTTYRWRWQTVEYNQGTKITHRSGVCDNSLIGTPKN